MFCDSATVAYRLVGINPATGKNYKPFKFFPFKTDDALVEAYNSCPKGCEVLLLPCNRCMLCTGRYRRHWVLRCQHELKFHDRSCFLTLTVDDEHLDSVFPKLSRKVVCFSLNNSLRAASLPSTCTVGYDNSFSDGCSWVETSKWNSLRHKPFQDFMKRLRITLQRGYKYGVDQIYQVDKPIRYYMCGEYGDNTHRPHYHCILFGVHPPDTQLLLFKPGLGISPLFSKLWPFGYHTVAKVDPACISYVAGYVDKKMDDSRMSWIDNFVAPEYVCMSRRPGLGGKFWEQFHDTDLYPENDDGTFPRIYACLGKNGKVKMPKYYDDLLALHDPEKFGRLSAYRKVAVSDTSFDLIEWLNESHRRCAVAVERRRQRDPGVMSQVKPGQQSVA